MGSLTKIPNSMLKTPGGGGGAGGAIDAVVAGVDITAINAALTSGGNSSTIYFPPGNYTVDGLTANYSDQTWLCSRGAVFTKAAGSTAAMLTLAASGLRIKGGEWNGNRSGAPATAVFVDGTNTDFSIEDAYCHGFTSWGIAIDNGELIVDNCKFADLAYAAVIWRATSKNGSDFRKGPRISRTKIDRRSGYTSSTGILIRSVGTGMFHQNASVIDCDIFMPSTGETTYDNVGIEITEGQFPRIANCHVEGSRIAYSYGGCSRGVVSDNTAVAVGDYIIELATACNDCAVTGNAGTGLSLTTTGIGGCVITGGGNGNVVMGNRIGRGFPNVVYQDTASQSASPANLVSGNI